MRRLVQVALVALALLVSASAVEAQEATGAAPTAAADEVLDVAAVKNILERSVVRIEGRDCEAMSGGTSCQNGLVSTGFFVRIEGELFIATTLHGVAYYPQIYWSATNMKTATTSIVRVNNRSDLALLAVLNPDEVTALGFVPLELGEANLDELAGKPVTSIGFKLGLEQATAEQDQVRILAPRLIADLLPEETKLDPDLKRFFSEDTRTLQLQLRLDPGDSGGPILLGHKVVGISHGGIPGSSFSWAMPAGELLLASKEDKVVDDYLGESAARRQGQDAAIRLFSTDSEVTKAHALTAPMRFTFMLQFSTRTQLLAGYASRASRYTVLDDNPGYWFPGDGPVASDAEAFPGSPTTMEQLFDEEPGVRSTLEAIAVDENRFLDLLWSSAIRIECETEDQLGRPGQPYWPDTTFHAFALQQPIERDQVLLARDRDNVYVYPRAVMDLSPFGRIGGFRSYGRRGPLTDIDLRGGLCAVNLVPQVPRDQGGDDPAMLKPLNDAMKVGSACIVLYLSDGAEMQLKMIGQSIDPSLDPERLYGILVPMNQAGFPGTARVCDAS